MFRSALLSITLAFSLVRANDTSTKQVVAAFTADNVTTDLGMDFDPSVVIQVQFPTGNNTFFNVTAGATVPRNVTAAMPLVNILTPTADPGDFVEGDEPVIVPPAQSLDTGNFVFAMVDLDAPTPQNPNISEIRHFLGSNFTLFPAQNPDALALLFNFTPAITEYMQPTPPPGSDAHRYVFLVFTQPPTFDEQTVVTPDTSTQNFSIAGFADATGLGSPLGGTFMFVAPDADESA